MKKSEFIHYMELSKKELIELIEIQKNTTKIYQKLYELSELEKEKLAISNGKITNADKFKEVFGVNVVTNTIHCCSGIACKTLDCGLCECNGFWRKEYKEPKGSE